MNNQIGVLITAATGKSNLAKGLSTWVGLLLCCLVVGGCGREKPAYTPTPTKAPLPLNPSTAAVTPVVTATLVAASPTGDKAEGSPIQQEFLAEATTAGPSLAQDMPPTQTPVPLTTLVRVTPPIATPEPPTTQLPLPTAPPAPISQPVPLAPPQRGGSWDMEEGFYSWPSPYENFGGFVANGWASFINAYEPESDPITAPRLNENRNPVNVYSGQHSQEISFDYRLGEIGIWRTVTVTPNHRYTLEAWGKYTASPGGLQLDLGIDLTGDTNFEAATVTWYPWRNLEPDRWLATQETVVAGGNAMTIFLRAVHPVAEPGGNTVFDNVSLTDLGPLDEN